MNGRRRGWAGILGWNAAGLLLVLMLCEAVFGGWFSADSFAFLNVPRNLSLRYDTAALFAGGTIRYSRDEYGFRGRRKPVSEIDILTLGGSTTDQIYIDDNATWQALLERRHAADGRDVDVVNAGIDGQSTYGHLRNFDAWFARVPGLHARYVLAYVGINDRFADAPLSFDETEDENLRRRLKRYVVNNSILVRGYRVLVGLIKVKRAGLDHGVRPAHTGDWQPFARLDAPIRLDSEMTARVEAYRDRLRRLAMRIRSFGAEPIFVSQHYGSYRIRGDTVLGAPTADGTAVLPGDYAEARAFADATMAVCRLVDATCIDLFAKLRFRDGDFYDFVHLTPQGTARLVDFLYAELKSQFE